MNILKFGGTSLATPQRIFSAIDIINKEKADIIVVSAPGKRFKGDIKITDLLFDCYKARLESGKCDKPFLEVERRIIELASGVGVTGIKPYLDQIRHDINCGESIGYTVSRGEFLCALIIRHLLSCEFIDAKEIIKFDASGKIDFALSYNKTSQRLKGVLRAVIPGYYGVLPNGEIKTFSRGGSDVSASIIAAGAGATEYQNWTDVDGVYFCPITEICGTVDILSYKEMRELSFLGADILHPDSLLPLMESHIEVRIKNSFNQNAQGTLITSEEKAKKLLENEYLAFSQQDQNDDSYKSLPLAISGKKGFKMLSFYLFGSSGSNYLNQLINHCERQGGVIFTAACSVDCFNIVLCGEVLNIPNTVAVQDIAIITILGGNKNKILQKICNFELSPLLLQVDYSSSSLIIGVAESKLELWIEKLCKELYY